MIVIIPLGGTGERFKCNGYNRPKGLINVLGKPILYYLLDNTNFDNIQMVYIPYNKEYAKYRIEDMLRKDFPTIPFRFLCLDEATRGASETINVALKELDVPDCPIISLDGDNFYTKDILDLWNGQNNIICIEDDSGSPNYSYVKTIGGKVSEILEKERISNIACCGAYGFASYKELYHFTDFIIKNDIRDKSEFYISTLISEMLKFKIDFNVSIIHADNWICLGTPYQVRQFCNNYPKISCVDNIEKIQTQRICFDLDNTLVTYPVKKNDYTSVLPIQKNIDMLKYLKRFGHTIIIYTARRMKTHDGNTGKVMSDIGKITFDTLAKLDIPYDEIYFGKPYANIYIDDLAINAFEDLEIALGYHIEKIDPREFNKIKSTYDTVTKTSTENLIGEIYYYQNIPTIVKDMFPSFIDYDKFEFKWYIMEKISGLTMTTLYTSKLLTTTILINVMNSIHRLHSVQIEPSGLFDIYANYHKKLCERYKSYDYSKFDNSAKLYKYLCDELLTYQNKNKGKACMIHGDTVMTNIIINNHGKIKFIDMRGLLGLEPSIYGDCMYDWAKLYQSLIGYDAILQSVDIPIDYSNSLIKCFENYFVSLYSADQLINIKIITKSFLFSLIPLHNNDKCYQYYNLIHKF